MEEYNKEQTLEIATELNTLGNTLQVDVIELLQEVDEYTTNIIMINDSFLKTLRMIRME